MESELFENEGQQPSAHQANGNEGQQASVNRLGEEAEQQPLAHQVRQSTSGLAIAGLVLGILAILGAFVPLLNIGAIPFALIGLVLAIAGFVGIRNGKHSGRGIAIAGIVLGAVALIVICGMYGCAGAIASSTGTHSSAGASSEASASASNAASAAKSVEMETNRTVDVPFTFFLPKGWVKEESENGRTYYYPSATERTALLYAGGESATLSADQSESDYLETFVQGALKSAGDFKIVEETDLSLSGYAAKRVKAQGTVKNNSGTMSLQMCAAYVPGYVVAFMGGSMNGKYDAEISAVLDSLAIATASSSSAAQSSEASTESSPSATADNGAVSPDLKDALDSYEAFMDEYIAFMERYNSSDDTASMMTDYLNYLQKYSDFMEKIGGIDTDSMSTADYAYYIEVTSRVSQKLLSVM